MALPPHVEKFVAGALEETSKSGGIVQGVRKVLDFLQAEGLSVLPTDPLQRHRRSQHEP